MAGVEWPRFYLSWTLLDEAAPRLSVRVQKNKGEKGKSALLRAPCRTPGRLVFGGTGGNFVQFTKHNIAMLHGRDVAIFPVGKNVGDVVSAGGKRSKQFQVENKIF